MPHRILRVPERGMLDAYEGLLAVRTSLPTLRSGRPPSACSAFTMRCCRSRSGVAAPCGGSFPRPICRVASISGAAWGAARAS